MVRDRRGIPLLRVPSAVLFHLRFLRRRRGIRPNRAHTDGGGEQRPQLTWGWLAEGAGLSELARGTQGRESGEDVAVCFNFAGYVGPAQAQLTGDHSIRRNARRDRNSMTGASAGPASEPSHARSLMGISSVPRTTASALASRGATPDVFAMFVASRPVLASGGRDCAVAVPPLEPKVTQARGPRTGDKPVPFFVSVRCRSQRPLLLTLDRESVVVGS